MGIGKRIKEARNYLGFTQEELAIKLGVTKGAVANYELETSHPKEPVMYKLIEVLQVDANYLFQDCVNIPDELDNVSLEELKMIKKFRALDERGKEMVKSVLEQAYDSIPRIMEGQISLIPIDGYYQVYHNGKWVNYKKCDDMFDSDMKPTVIKAAHNDSSDPAEQEKMLQDLENLKRPE